MFSFREKDRPSNWIEGQLVKTSPSFVAKFRKDKTREGPAKKDIIKIICVANGKWNESVNFGGVEYYNLKKHEPCLM